MIALEVIDKSKKYDGDCCICLKKIDADETITICKHYFHKKCLNQWIEYNNKCPVCRKELEIPVGCVIVKDGEIIARAHNQKEKKKDTTKHAEILAIQKASKKIDAWRLESCEMYVTLEPCSMCAGALIQSRIKKVYIGAMDEKTGSCGSVLNLLDDYKFNHHVESEIGLLEEDCRRILKDFFLELRKIKKN